jgi:epsilon-lactone hydrolase
MADGNRCADHWYAAVLAWWRIRCVFAAIASADDQRVREARLACLCTRFPAAIDDVLAAYRGLLASGVDPKLLAVAGDSAGGNLSLALSLSLRAADIPQPVAIALFSPATDFTGASPSAKINDDKCAMFTAALGPIVVDLYLGGADPQNPLASPVYADFAGLPPLLFHVGEDEVLLDDSVRAAERAKRAGIEVDIRIWPVVPHVWQMAHPFIPEGRESLRLANDFLVRHLATP